MVDPSTAITETFTYNWSVTKNALPYASALNSPLSTFMFTPDDNATYVVSLTVVDDDGGGPTAAPSQTITVTNVAPTIALAGASSVNEAAIYSLTLGAVTDPGTDTVSSYTVFWGDGMFDTYGTPGVKTHVYADDNPPITSSDPYTITVTLTDEDGVHPVAGTKMITVDNVAPTGTAINGGSVNEGSPGLVLVLGQSDVSAADIAGRLHLRLRLQQRRRFPRCGRDRQHGVVHRPSFRASISMTIRARRFASRSATTTAA